MALTQEIILAALKKRGLTEANAPHLTFETEAQMNTFLDSIVPPAPKVYKTVDEIMADEGLKGLVMPFVDKRVTDAKIKWEKQQTGEPIKPEDIASLITKSVQEALAPVTDQVTKLKAEREMEARNSKIKGLLSKEFPTEVHDLVLAAIPADADDAKITSIIGETKAKLTGLGLKDIGVPGQGGGGNGSTAKTEIEGWGDKKKKQAETKK